MCHLRPTGFNHYVWRISPVRWWTPCCLGRLEFIYYAHKCCALKIHVTAWTDEAPATALLQAQHWPLTSNVWRITDAHQDVKLWQTWSSSAWSHGCYNSINVTLCTVDISISMLCSREIQPDSDSAQQGTHLIHTVIISSGSNVPISLKDEFYTSTSIKCTNKKLIRRWDSERELHDDIVHALQNTKDWYIIFATDRRGYVLEHRFTKFSEITQCNGHYAVQGNSRSPILVHAESSYTTSYYWLILTYLLSCTVSKLWLIIGQIFALALVIPCLYRHQWYIVKTRFFGLHFRCRKYWCIFNHFYVIRHESYQTRWNYAAVRAITPFKVIQDHRVWYQSKAHMRLPISD